MRGIRIRHNRYTQLRRGIGSIQNIYAFGGFYGLGDHIKLLADFRVDFVLGDANAKFVKIGSYIE